MIAYELHSEAEEELYAAASRYEDLSPGFGSDFLDEVERAVAWVCRPPAACQLWPDVAPELGVRRKLLDRFPFELPYLSRDDRIVFLAVAHLSQARLLAQPRVSVRGRIAKFGIGSNML